MLTHVSRILEASTDTKFRPAWLPCGSAMVVSTFMAARRTCRGLEGAAHVHRHMKGLYCTRYCPACRPAQSNFEGADSHPRDR